MNKIILGILVGAAVAGIVYYLNDPEEAKSKLDDLKNKANDAFDSAKDYLSKKADEAQSSNA